MELFDELERSLNEASSSYRTFELTVEQKRAIKRTSFDYEPFRYDFDKTCRFIDLLAHLDHENFSDTQIILLKYILILSTFLKNRTSTKVSHENEILLESAKKALSSILSATVPQDQSLSNVSRLFACFALVNIHECVGVSKANPTQREALEILSNHLLMEAMESSLINKIFYYYRRDFQLLGTAMDETVTTEAFKKYTSAPRSQYRSNLEGRMLFIFSFQMFMSAFIFCCAVEVFVGIIFKKK